eukprot:694958-Amorphochlora_amoeboformis.AAC.1
MLGATSPDLTEWVTWCRESERMHGLGLGIGLGLGLGSDYSACLSSRTIDSSTVWGYIAVWDHSRSC